MFETKKHASRGARLAVTCGLGITLALGGVVAPVTPAFAAGTSSITINKAANGDYKVYQLFSGKFTEDGGKLHMYDAVTNDAYKDDIIAVLTEFGYALNIVGGESDHEVANKITDKIVELGKNDAQARKFANALAEKLNSKEATKVATATSGTLLVDGIEDGYYLIMADPADGDFTDAGLTSAILTPVNGDQTGSAKVSVPSVDKQVMDEGNGWDNSFDASADAGLVEDKLSQLTYQITAKIPTNIAEFTSGQDGKHNYQLTFVDTLPKGLDTTEDELANWQVSFLVNGATKNMESYFTATVETDSTTHTSTIKWATTDLKGALEAAGLTDADMAGASLSITYKPVYDQEDLKRLYEQNATLEDPQTNTVKLEFSNSPYSDGKGETPEEDAKVYSYNVSITKVDEEQQPLAGAEFSLTDANGKPVGKQTVSDQNGVFTWTGLESDVEYVLTETKTPAGMKSIDPVHFKIQAERDQEGNVIAVKYSEVSDPSGAVELNGSNATLQGSVVNFPGPDLPVTGQAGIIAGVAVGGVILAVSAVAMVRNRRIEA